MQPRDRHNLIMNVLGEALWGVQAGFLASATVLTVLLGKLGASPMQIGLIPALEGGLMVASQAAGAWLFTSTRGRKRHLILYHWLVIVPFLFLSGGVTLLAPRLPPAVARGALLVCFGGFNLSIGVIVAVWMDWLAHLFHTGIRGTVMGVSFFASALLSAAGSLGAGRLLALHPGLETYAAFYFGGGVVGLLAMLCFWFIRDPAEQGPETGRRPSPRELLDRFRTSLGDRNFRSFLLGRLLSIAGFCILPFVAVHYQSAAGGSLSAAQVVANGAALTLGMAVAHLTLGRLGDRHGHRLGVLVGALAQIAALSVVLTVRGNAGCRLVYLLAGVCASAGFLSSSNLVIESCPHDHRLAHITAANVVLALPILTLPFLAGLLAQAAGLQALFAVSLAFSVAAALWFLFRVREPRDVRLVDAGGA